MASLIAPSRSYGNRFGPAKGKAIGRYGGTPGGAVAVAEGLAWLAAHQDESGRWDRVGFLRHCPGEDRCWNEATQRLDRNGDVGITALALLAFLGDGHLPNDALDLYRDTVRKAIDFIIAQQQEGGQFGLLDIPKVRLDDKRRDPLLMYNHAIATLALAEAYSLTHDGKLVEPVTAAYDYLTRTQQPQGGWDYWPMVTNRNDTSITGWAVMAIKAAHSAGLPVSALTPYRAAGHFSRATDPDGRVIYADKHPGVTFDKQTGLPRFRYGPAMTAVGVFSRLLLGYRLDSPVEVVGANMLAADLPNLAALRGGDPSGLHSEYYWYYGTLAMFQMGGRYWAAWNPQMQRAILEARDRSLLPDGKKAHRYGSWPAYGNGWGHNWGAEGGRIYATAINVLTLETFFRYLPLNEMPADYDYSSIVDQVLATGEPADRRAIINWLGQLRPQLAEPVLYKLARGPQSPLRFQAAVQLARCGSPLARQALTDVNYRASPSEKVAAEQALMALGGTPVPDVFGPVTEVDVKRGLIAFRTGGAYVGYGLGVKLVDKAGKTALTGTVASFDREAGTAIGKLDKDHKDDWAKVAPGQIVKLEWY